MERRRKTNELASAAAPRSLDELRDFVEQVALSSNEGVSRDDIWHLYNISNSALGDVREGATPSTVMLYSGLDTYTLDKLGPIETQYGAAGQCLGILLVFRLPWCLMMTGIT